MRTIVDKRGTEYAVDAKLIAGMIVYTVHAGDEMVARAVFDPMRGAVTDVLVYRETDRRRGIASSLYDLIEQDIGRPLRPSRIRSYAGRAFWARRRQCETA
jgi:ribosomal protein S18 acetylase RimI-like enzyme